MKHGWKEIRWYMSGQRWPVPFVLIVNVHFWNYYVPSLTYAREPPFNHVDSTFSRIPAHNIAIAISLFSWAGRKTEQGERHAEPMIAPRSPTCPPPWHRAPNHLPIIHCQVKIHSAPRHFASPRAAERMSPLHFAKPFLRALTFFVLRYCHDGRGRGGDSRHLRLWIRRRTWTHRRYLMPTCILCCRRRPLSSFRCRLTSVPRRRRKRRRRRRQIPISISHDEFSDSLIYPIIWDRRY